MSSEPLEALILGYFAQTLSPEQERTLAGLLAASAEHRARLMAYMRLEGATWQLATARTLSGPPGEAAEHASDDARPLRTGRGPARSWSRVGLAMAACTLIGIGLFALLPSEPAQPVGIAVVSHASPQVNLVRDGHAIPVSIGMQVLAQDRIQVATAPADGKAEIIYPDHTRMQVLRATDVRLWDEDGAKRVRLVGGEVRCEVAHQPVGRPMKLLTDQAEAEVVGTRFTLHAEPARSRLAVEVGEVLLRRADGKAVAVRAGYVAVAAADVPFEATTIQGVSAATPPSRSQPVKPRENVVYDREFADIPADEKTVNQLTMLPEAGGAVSAIVAEAYPLGAKTSTWNPDVFIELSARGDLLYAVPERMEILVRIKAEKPGKWYLTQTPSDPRFRAEHFYWKEVEIASEWQDVVLRTSDMTPYMSEGPTREFVPGLGIERFGIFGYGTGRLFVDRFTVVSLGDHEANR